MSEQDRMMLEYAWKLTVAPWQIVKADVEQMQQHGFADRDILDINLITGYFAFANRLADGLGVELESFWDQA